MKRSVLHEGRRPPRLRHGDHVALVAPSGPAPPDRIGVGIAIAREWGLVPRVMAHVGDVHDVHAHLAGADRARADDFAAAWSDPEVRAILCVRGGFGAQRMVDMIDWEALADLPPKVVVGYSDVTALHQAIAAHLGVVTLHGPMMSTADLLDSAAAQEHLRATLFEPETVRVLAGPDAHRVIGGTASGVTVGGCASVLSTSIGTAGTITDNTGGIALLEDVNEPAYRLDSYLTHLRRAGWFDGVVGIVLGSWAGCEPAEPVVLDVLGDLGVPILGELGFGHGADPITVPLGVRAHLDADAGTLVVAEPALG